LIGVICPDLEWQGLYSAKRNNKKKSKVGRAGSACPKDYGIMFCSSLTNHPSGLIPFPFGLSASRPVKLLSFSFFRFFCFLLENIFFGFCTGSAVLRGFVGAILQSFPNFRKRIFDKSIFIVLKAVMQAGKYMCR
jgi:hypothetical protein